MPLDRWSTDYSLEAALAAGNCLCDKGYEQVSPAVPMFFKTAGELPFVLPLRRWSDAGQGSSALARVEGARRRNEGKLE